MKRRNTIDNLHGNWPIVQYYYTHNNGSCDDILIHHKSLDIDATTSKQISKKHQSDYKNRRKTFPQEKIAVEFQQYQNGRRDSNKIEIAITAASPIIRRWSTTKKQQQQQQQQQQQKNRKKRETLANIISNLSRSNSSTVTGGNISSSNNNDTIRVESDLDIKWETIRQYNPQLDNEKILEQDDGDNSEDDEGYSHDPISQEQRNDAAVVNMNDSSSSSSNDSNELFLPAGQDNTAITTNMTTTDGIVAIPMDPTTASNNEIVSSTAKAHPAALETIIIPMSINVEHTDMFLFLFGFIFFPLWWVGTWRFFMQPDKSFIHKQQRGFQIVNCCMTLASLLMTGLIVGLVTVWA